jgi:hypothetical protein
VTSHQPRVIKKLYTALVHPHLEFGMTVANPHFNYDIEILDKVQHIATKVPFAKQQISYKQQLEKLDLTIQTYCRKRGNVNPTFKMMTSDTIKLVFDHSEYTRTQGNPKKLHQKFSRMHEKLNFFTDRVVPLWNSLSRSNMSARSVDIFKIGVDHDWSSKSWKTQWDKPVSFSRVY